MISKTNFCATLHGNFFLVPCAAYDSGYAVLVTSKQDGLTSERKFPQRNLVVELLRPPPGAALVSRSNFTMDAMLCP